MMWCRFGWHSLFPIGWGTSRCRRCRRAFTHGYANDERSEIREERPRALFSLEADLRVAVGDAVAHDLVEWHRPHLEAVLAARSEPTGHIHYKGWCNECLNEGGRLSEPRGEGLREDCQHAHTTCDECGMGFMAMTPPLAATPPAPALAEATQRAIEDMARIQGEHDRGEFEPFVGKRPPEALDVERLARALVDAFRAVAKVHQPWLNGDGWPAYSEKGASAQVILVNDLARVTAREYAALAPERQE